MEKIQAFMKLSFSTKVIVPVVGIMVLLLMMTVWLVNRRLTQQFQSEAVISLATANLRLEKSQEIRRNELLLRYRNLPREPRYKATFQAEHRKTVTDQLADLQSEHGLDVILFTTKGPELFAFAKRDPAFSIAAFEAASAKVVKDALLNEEKVDTIRVGDRVFDVVSIPVRGTGDHLIGVLTLASEIGGATAKQWSDISQCQIVLLANGRVVASTLPRPELYAQFVQLFGDCISHKNLAGSPMNIPLDDEHFFCSAGNFASLSDDKTLGWLLLSSYQRPLRSLQGTQQMLLGISASGILLGTVISWLLVRRVTQPLRELRNSAEAVGKGDFSHRVEVTTGDECGELAYVFNQMTENLQRSREQLERTVDTLKTTQAQLVQSEKLSGIGEFVAGVAHELNNPLTSVMGFSELLTRADTNPQHKRHLDLIHKSALRCQKIVQSLLSFSRRHQPERKLSSINELVEGAVEFLQYQLRTSNIEVTTRLDANLPKALVDPHQVQQVFLNLINNARQAIEAHQPKGCIRISTETCGQNVRIVFQDNGPGIPEENLSKVFDPFFTTKEVGKGTGLGLSLCYGIIKEHDGTVVVRSKPGEGAVFTIEFPLAIGGEESGQKPTPISKPAPQSREGAGKKVLVVDDEEAILEMMRETLSESGYEVDVARDGESALRRLNQTRYDLTLCDWKMPGLNGQQVYERLRASNPALSERIIFITGDVVNDRTQNFLQEQKKLCLSKPFSLVEFRAAIGQALAMA